MSDFYNTFARQYDSTHGVAQLTAEFQKRETSETILFTTVLSIFSLTAYLLRVGSRTTLYLLLEEGRWLRLHLTSHEAITSNAGAMTTVTLAPSANDGLFANLASVLVRPDGYLALVCPAGDARNLQAVLSS
jgi:aromatic ring hydroxylase-like protein